ncbi:MAG: hypothetical protein CMI79_03235 [Candidatus Pelagibacter sp.]|nr:hypothetical protein [Candidatus Pelagibacter sp.]|tara:strand:+ start:97 stop:1257 length:1161 start_codon:yes stop_codon:yes gene_type:complete
MRKILFVSSAPLTSKTLDGKESRALSILKCLSKKNKIDVVCIDKNRDLKKKKISFCNKEIRFKISIFSRLLNTLISFFKLQPLQNGYFYSKDIHNFVENNKSNYDTIIFHLIRCCQYLPLNFEGKKILEMTDLVSARDKQIINNLSLINPLKYLYILERFLVKRYERKIVNEFDKVVFISRKEILEAGKIVDKKKIEVIESVFDINKKIFKYNKNNNKIVFLGNINYLPNKLACSEFAKNILPKINKKYPDITLNIIGKINIFDKFYFKFYKNVIIHGPILNLKSYFKNSICGICNVKIASGFQNKIINYMSYGLPVILSKESFSKDILKKNKNVIVYLNNNELIRSVINLKKNRKFAEKISANSYKAVKKKFKGSKIFLKYEKII